MRAPAKLCICISIAATVGLTLPSFADAAQMRSRATAVRRVTPRPLDLSQHGPSVAMEAAKQAQAATLPGAAPAPGAAQPVEAPTSAPAGTVSGLTVTP